MSRIIMRMGHTVKLASSLETGLKMAAAEEFDIIFLDVQLPDGNGLQHLPFIQNLSSAPEVIIITGFANVEGAELAIRNNAWDYLPKPLGVQAITQSIHRALQYREERRACRPKVMLRRDGIIGNSPKIKACLELIARAAKSQANILLTGETGTGKELFARAIHVNSPRANESFVVVDCGSLPESLIESLLLGHTKGAYTGADKAEEGLIKRADGGTLFLDEVGELTPSMQKVFLRVLQERRFYPVGDSCETKSDFRLVAASNRDLDEMVTLGQFREDLLFRLCSITIHLPPLRERPEDIIELSTHYMRILCESQNLAPKRFSSELFDVLKAYRWPGNVRELYSVLEATLAHALYESTLFAKHLPKNIRIEAARSGLCADNRNGMIARKADDPPQAFQSWQSFRRAHIAEGEKRYLTELISLSSGNILKAAEISGISRPHLYGLLRKYRISV